MKNNNFEKKKLNITKSGNLLLSVRQISTHWSGIISEQIGYAVAINIAIWTYFANSYIQSSRQSTDFINLLLAAGAISSIFSGLWRLYARYLDDKIANLYPEFIYHENILELPTNYGTTGYLMENVPNIRMLFENKKLSFPKKLYGLKELISKKRIGDRGHLTIDLIVITLLLGVFIISFYSSLQVQTTLTYPLLFGELLGITIILICILRYQRNPKEKEITKLINKLTQIKKK